MNFHIYLKTLRDYKKSTIWFFVGTVILGLYTTGFYPSIKDSSNMIALLEELPEWTQAIIGDASSYTTAEGFLNLEVFEIMAPLIVAVYVITKGADSIAGEEESHTLDQLLSLPVSRLSVMAQKTLAILTGTLFICGGIWLGITSGSIMMGFNVSQGNLGLAIMSLFVFGLVIASLSICLSSSTGKRGLSAGVTGGVAIGSFLANNFGKVLETLEPIRLMSIFYYYNDNGVMVNGINPLHFVIMLISILVLLLSGFLIFNIRDLKN